MRLVRDYCQSGTVEPVQYKKAYIKSLIKIRQAVAGLILPVACSSCSQSAIWWYCQ